MNSRLILALAALTFIALQASSEVSDSTIEAYNNAVQSGSKAELIDAAKALSDEVVASPEADNAALLAFEAGWALCRSGSCEDAISPASFANSRSVAAGEHPTAADRELLLSYAEWSVDKNTETRAALDAALVGRVDSPPTLLTVTAFHNRYLNDLSNDRPEEAIKTASAAERHMAQAKDQLGQLWSGAALAIQTTKFNHEQSPKALIGIAELFAELKLMRHVSSSPSPDWLRDRYYEANAWYSAINAFFASEDRATRDRRRASDIVEDAITDENHTHPEDGSPHEVTKLPVCPGDINRAPRPRYPDVAASDGYVGSVIIVYNVDEAGKLNPRVAASVPTDIFDEAALKSVERLRWKWEDPEPDAPPCRKQIEEVVQSFEFVLQSSTDIFRSR